MGSGAGSSRLLYSFYAFITPPEVINKRLGVGQFPSPEMKKLVYLLDTVNHFLSYNILLESVQKYLLQDHVLIYGSLFPDFCVLLSVDLTSTCNYNISLGTHLEVERPEISGTK
jgi:hypothetical protein